jgi:type IV pilus assembly protein PilQ
MSTQPYNRLGIAHGAEEMMMKRTAHRPKGFSVICIAAAAVTALFSLSSAEAGKVNQIQDVRITETQGKTVVSIVGSSRPDFTAFRLSSPSRLVIDVAGSQIRGVPPLIDSKTKLLEGVAVSQYTVKGIPVSRIMIGFKSEAAYRVSISGSTLTATLAGSPSELKIESKSDDAKAAAVDAESRVSLEKAEREIALLKDENRKQQENYQAAETKAEKAESAMNAAFVSADRANTEAKKARAKLDEAMKTAAALEQKASALEQKASAAQKTMSRSVEAENAAASSKEQLENWRREATIARQEARQAALELKAVEMDAASAKSDAMTAKAEAKRAKEEEAKAKKEMAALKQDAEIARTAEARSAKEAEQAAQKARAAEERLTELRKESDRAQKTAVSAETEIASSRLAAKQAMSQAEQTKAELAALRKEIASAKAEADEAKKNLSRYQDVDTHKNQIETQKYKVSLLQSDKQVKLFAAQAAEAESSAKQERNERQRLEAKVAELSSSLSAAQTANQTSEASRLKAEQAAEALKKKLEETKSSLTVAQREARAASDAQVRASEAVKRAAKAERKKLLATLKEKEIETVKAARRAEAIRKDKDLTEKSLVSAEKSLALATSEARIKEEYRSRADRELAAINAKYEQAANASKDWEMRATKLRAEMARLQQEIADTKMKAESDTAEIRQIGEDKVSAARAALAEAEAREKTALQSQEAAEAKLNQYLAEVKKANTETMSLEAQLAMARRTITNQETEIDKLSVAKANSDKAAIDAKLAAVRAEQEAKEAQTKADKAVAESKSLVAQAEARSVEVAAKAEKETAEAALSIEAAKREAAVAQQKARMTQEEMRLARLAELQNKNSATKPIASNLSSNKKTVTADTPTISAVEFKSDKDAQRVIIKSSTSLEYSVSTDPSGNASLTFKDVKLAPLLERTLDVTDFNGIINNVSSYQKKDRVVVEVGVGRKAESVVNRSKNAIEIVFREKGTPETATKGPASPLGANSRTVAQESADTYSNPYERTAPSTVDNSGGGKKKKYTGRRVDLDFKDADIHNILRLLSDVGRVNIITSDDVKGTVTIRMRDVAWDQALDIILQAKQLGMVREGNLIRVAPQSVLEQEREMEIARRKQRIALEPLETRLIPISYATAGELMPRAQDLLSERGKLSVDARTNVIIARDTKDTLNQIEALIRNLDTQTPQVLIESRIVEATSLYAREIGIQWGGDFSASSAYGNPTGLAFPNSIGLAGGATDSKTPMEGLATTAAGQPNPNFGVNLPAPVGTNSGGALGITLGSIANNANLSLRLSAMEETGTLRILSSPKILTLDNREAYIEQGTLIPYSQVSAQGVQTAFKEAKLNLTVTPHVTADGSVLLKMRVMRDEPDFNNTGAGGDPTILKREAETELLVSDGHTAVIGGIFTRNAGTSFKKVPFFADIPIIGWLFKKKSDSDRRTEMLIFITPRIVNRAESIGR